MKRTNISVPPWPGFASGSSHVGFVVEKVALGQVFSEYFGFPLLPIFIPPISPQRRIEIELTFRRKMSPPCSVLKRVSQAGNQSQVGNEHSYSQKTLECLYAYCHVISSTMWRRVVCYEFTDEGKYSLNRRGNKVKPVYGWRRYISPKHLLNFTGLYGVRALFISTAVITSSRTQF
jgi:hypothetical protein